MKRFVVSLVLAGVMLASWTAVTAAQSAIVGWGLQVMDSRWSDQPFAEVAGGRSHTLVRDGNGSIVAWGDNSSGQCNVPVLPAGLTYAQIAAGYSHSVALRSDGSAVGFGNNGNGQCSVAALPAGLTYVEIA